MQADQIRGMLQQAGFKIGNISIATSADTLNVVMLAEIAAQLAEVNEKLDRAVDALATLDQTRRALIGTHTRGG